MTLLGSSISEAHSLSQDAKIAVASSVTVFVVLSILFFIIGFLCGRFGRKEKKKTDIASQPDSEYTQPQITYYDNIDQFDIKPKINVAYGQVSLTNI